MPIPVSYSFNEQVKLMQIPAELARRELADRTQHNVNLLTRLSLIDKDCSLSMIIKWQKLLLKPLRQFFTLILLQKWSLNLTWNTRAISNCGNGLLHLAQTQSKINLNFSRNYFTLTVERNAREQNYENEDIYL